MHSSRVEGQGIRLPGQDTRPHRPGNIYIPQIQHICFIEEPLVQFIQSFGSLLQIEYCQGSLHQVEQLLVIMEPACRVRKPVARSSSTGSIKPGLVVSKKHLSVEFPCPMGLSKGGRIPHPELGGGLGELAGKVWRIGLMGESAQEANVFFLLSALERIMSKLGYEVAYGASLAAAQQTLATIF